MALLFLSRLTAPEIHYSVIQCGRFANAPRMSHWKAALRILKYVVTHKKTFLITYRRSPEIQYPEMYGFSDSEFASVDVDTRKSYIGAVVFFGGAAIHWIVKQNKIATRGTAQTEYFALSLLCDMVKEFRIILECLGYEEFITEATTCYCDTTRSLLVL